MKTIVLDATPLVMLEKDEQRIIGLIERARNREEAVTIVPANALAQAWRGDGSRQALLHRMLNKGQPTCCPSKRARRRPLERRAPTQASKT